MSALLMLAGPPGAGKSTLAEAIVRRTGAVWLSVDAAEDGMLAAGMRHDERTGLAAYVAVERLAEPNLLAGCTVLIDAVNDHPLARQQWYDLAARAGVPLVGVELVVPPGVQAGRLLGRRRAFGHLPEPDAASSLGRAAAFAAWTDDRLRLDATRPSESLAGDVLRALGSVISSP